MPSPSTTLSVNTIMLNGYCVPSDVGTEEHNALIEYYTSDPATRRVFGNSDEGFSVKSVLDSIEDCATRIRIDINAHGITQEVSRDSSSTPRTVHKIQIGNGKWVSTISVIKKIVAGLQPTKEETAADTDDVKVEEKIFEIHLWSCYAGACMSEVSLLDNVPKGFVFFAHGPRTTDAWSVNLYKAQLVSLRNYDPSSITRINLPSDAIEGLSVVMNVAGEQIQYHLHELTNYYDAEVVSQEINKWVIQGIQTNIDLALIEEFMHSMCVTAIRSNPSKFLASPNADDVITHLTSQDLNDIRNPDELDSSLDSIVYTLERHLAGMHL